MPLYVFRCETCGHQFEELKKISDPNPPCSKITDGLGAPVVCGHETQKLIVSGSNFHLKGKGWASDGYT